MGQFDDLSILVLTLQIAIAATLAIVPIGLATAWWIARRSGPTRVTIETLLALPLVLPPTAIGIVLLLLIGNDGIVGRWLEARGLEVAFTWRAAALASAIMAFPIFVRSARAAFEEIDPRLLAVARTLGDGSLRVFWRVALPLAWRGIAAGALLAFCRALGEFGATILIAGNIPGRTQTLALAIFQRSQSGREGDALRLVGLTSLIALCAVFASEFVHRRRRRTFAA